MSSARPVLTIVGSLIGKSLFGPVGAIFGPAVGSEIGGDELPGDCAYGCNEVPAIRGERAPTKTRAEPS